MKMHLKCSFILLLIFGVKFFAVLADETPAVNEQDEGIDEDSLLGEIDEVKNMDPFGYAPIGPGNMLPLWVKDFNKSTEDQPHIIEFSYPIQKSSLTLTASIRDSLKDYWKTLKGTRLPSNCDEALMINKKNGVYKMELPNSYIGAFHANCMQTDQTQWMFIQRRIDGKIQFDRDWNNYKNGFGELTGEFWLGLDLIHAITSSRPHELWIQLKDHKNVTKYAYYKTFLIGDEDSKYALKRLGGYSGNAGDSLLSSAGLEFSTKDADYDNNDKGHCAKDIPSGWWFNNCGESNLNGPYYAKDENAAKSQGVQWNSWLGKTYSLKYAHMAIRPIKKY